MKTLQSLLLATVLVLATAVLAQAAPTALASWSPSDVITSPLGASFTEVQQALASKGIAPEQHGAVVSGTHAVNYTGAENNAIELTFDGNNRLEGASTSITSTDATEATSVMTSIIAHIEEIGGLRTDNGNVDLNDGSVTYSVNGTDGNSTVTVGRNAGEPNVIWVVVNR